MYRKNRVIAGKYSGCNLDLIYNNLYIQTGRYKTLDINKKTVESYKLVDKNSYSSVAGHVTNAFIGRIIFGPIGMITGAVLPSSEEAYLVSLKYKDGSESLIEISKRYYKALAKSMY